MIVNMGRNVKIARIKAGLSQAELAELVELSVDTIKRIEQGTLAGSLETFCKLCDILKVSPNYLLKDDVQTVGTAVSTELADRFLNLSEEQLYVISTILDKLDSLLNDKEE